MHTGKGPHPRHYKEFIWPPREGKPGAAIAASHGVSGSAVMIGASPMKMRSIPAFAAIALAASSAMVAPAFAKSHHHRHHGHRAAMATHASPAKQAAVKTSLAPQN